MVEAAIARPTIVRGLIVLSMLVAILASAAIIGGATTPEAGLHILIVLVGSLILFALWNSSEWLFLVVAAYCSGFFTVTFLPQPFQIGGLGLYPFELLLVVLLGRMVLHDWFHHGHLGIRSPILPFLLLFLAALSLSALVHINGGDIDARTVALRGRVYLIYALFVVVLYGLKNMEQAKRYLLGLCAIGLCNSAAFLLQYVLGSRVGIFPGVVKINGHVEQSDAVTRIYAGGILFSFLLPIFVLLLTLPQPLWRRALLVAATALSGIHLVLTFTRTIWYAMLIGLLVAWLLTRGLGRVKLLAFGALLAVAALAGALLLDALSSSSGRELLPILVSRFVSPASGPVETVNVRLIEIATSMPFLLRSPLLGIGVGQTWGMFEWYATAFNGQGGNIEIYNAQNSYWNLLLHAGILGTIPFLVFVGLGTARALLLAAQIGSPHWRMVLIGIGAGMVVVLVTCLQTPRFYEMFGIDAVTAMLGLSEAVLALNRSRGAAATAAEVSS